MMNVVGCFVGSHDPWLVGLAAVICGLASITTVELLRHAQHWDGRSRFLWLAVAATAGGSGIWATHFVAMLAFAPGLPGVYDVGLTAVSLVFAIVLTVAGLAVALAGRSSWVQALGGGIVGGGIAAMHYTGMAAFQIAGHMRWNGLLVGASILVGMVFGSLALRTALNASRLQDRVFGAGLLLLAICGHHFTGMGAVTIVPDPTVLTSGSALPTNELAIAVALASFLILVLACGALALDIRDRRHILLEGERLRSLANAAVEGLVVCHGEDIVSANDSFARLVGSTPLLLRGNSIKDFLPNQATRIGLATVPDHPVEAMLRQANGTDVPVELIVRPVDYANRPHYAIAVRDLRARRTAEKQIHFLAHHDALTGLANRISFNKKLEHEIRVAAARDRKLAVLCLDLDRFKEVNDLFGHAAGDALLENVARIVAGVLDETQLMARLGGDEFAILTGCDNAMQAGTLAERVLDVLRAESAEGGGPQIATSIGVAIYPDDAADRQTLLSCADTALYRAKAECRGTYRYFETKMGVEVRDRRLLEHDLRHAIGRGEMHLVYQPQIGAMTGTVTGFEALLRWTHPQRGTISPAVFIPLAEECGVIMQIGEWVLRETCRQASTWRVPLGVAVNISGVQMYSSDLGGLVRDVLVETGLDPRRLELEITETALIRDPIRALTTLRQLKLLGISIAMDDFGTGYSSLSNLRSFPFDRIKIDGSFIKSVDSNDQAAAIVRSVLGLGRGLGLPVIAEGVETEAEMLFLQKERCEAIQGYLVGRPVPIEQLSNYTVGETAQAA